ncbi:MAG: glycerol-3-phosphate dehydrogenase/oxidase [Actinomycetota bacterium]
MNRPENLEHLATATFDVAVIGGGITGAGIALDAVTRGLSVALLERDDFASGTSSKSSKLVHGGLRYMQHAEFGLVHENNVERDRLRRLAPHLVTPMRFVIPKFPGTKRMALLRLGLVGYDVLAGFRNFAPHRHASAAAVSQMVPALPRQGLMGGLVYYDAQADDARLTVEIVKAAGRFGACVANHARVVGVAKNMSGQAVGVDAEDTISGRAMTVRARQIVNATGVWADEVAHMVDPEIGRRLAPSKGVHLLFPSSLLPLRASVLAPSVRGDGRFVFVIPWGEQVIAGTTDTEYSGDLDRPTVEADDAAYIVEALRAMFGDRVALSNAVGCFAGLRPLLGAGRSAAAKDLSRRHSITRCSAGVLTITGGKLTTYRQMAEEAVDEVVRALGHGGRCVTGKVRLGLATDLATTRREATALASSYGLGRQAADAVVRAQGDAYPEVMSLAAERDLRRPLLEGLPYLAAQALYAARSEMACTLEDVLSRRMRVALRARDAGASIAAEVAALVGEELGWSPEVRDAQVVSYLAAVRGERGVMGDTVP